MSKQIKQMEMDALKQTFHGVRDMVLLSMTGVNCQTDNQARLGLRKKNIQLQVVKNSLAKRVFDEMGMQTSALTGPTVIAWGANSLAELSRELDTLFKKNDHVKFKGALSEGLEIDFRKALTMPTRGEALGRVVSLLLSPASRLVSQIQAPGARIAGQIKTLKERPAEAEPPAAAAPA